MTMVSKLLAVDFDRVIVTGGGSGIGRAVTLALTELGVHVTIMGRRLEKLEETASLCKDHPGKVTCITCDIRDIGQAKAAFEKANAKGPIRALVNSAGEVAPCLAERLTPEIFGAAVSSMLVGAFNIFSIWSRAMIKAGAEGALVAYTSTVNSRESAGLSHSGTVKAGVESMIRTWSMELGKYNLRFNAIGPGLFPLTGTHHDDIFNRDKFIQNIPLGRFGIADEIVGPTLFLLSPAARYMTGSTLMVDGGMRLRPWFGFTPEDLADYGEPIDA